MTALYPSLILILFQLFQQDVSYGAKDVVLSPGETLTCQNAVQEVLTEVIIRMYENYHEVMNKKINFE